MYVFFSVIQRAQYVELIFLVIHFVAVQKYCKTGGLSKTVTGRKSVAAAFSFWMMSNVRSAAGMWPA